MNDFKKQYELPIKPLKPQVYTMMENHIKQGKEEEGQVIKSTEEEKKRNRMVDLINRAYRSRKIDRRRKKRIFSN